MGILVNVKSLLEVLSRNKSHKATKSKVSTKSAAVQTMKIMDQFNVHFTNIGQS